MPQTDFLIITTNINIFLIIFLLIYLLILLKILPFFFIKNSYLLQKNKKIEKIILINTILLYNFLKINNIKSIMFYNIFLKKKFFFI